ncbi:hypothetical protein AB6A40_005961 [Gnathostoma spinigerum]|uniref:Uncharacterized protein n=1 Tax=Gnathostoma spinigerum TaxID=75299 RepID=A0ABD6ERS7_9BILA
MLNIDSNTSGAVYDVRTGKLIQNKNDSALSLVNSMLHLDGDSKLKSPFVQQQFLHDISSLSTSKLMVEEVSDTSGTGGSFEYDLQLNEIQGTKRCEDSVVSSETDRFNYEIAETECLTMEESSENSHEINQSLPTITADEMERIQLMNFYLFMFASFLVILFAGLTHAVFANE